MAALFAALPFALTSCGDDDEDDPEIANSEVVGTWEVTSQSVAFGELEGDAMCLLRFKKDGSFVQVVDDDGDVTIDYGTWTYSGTLLTIDYDGEQLPLQITSISSKKIVALIYGGLSTVELTKVKDSKIEAYLKDDSSSSSGEFKVNGTVWKPSSFMVQGFNDCYEGSDCYYLSMTFYRKGNSVIKADNLSISLVPNDYAITVGMDLADQKGFEAEYNENMYQESNSSQPWKEGTYKKKASGHAYVKKYVKNKSLTIQFSNLKLNYSSSTVGDYYDGDYDFSHPSTITLDGTVTFTYDGD